MKAEKSGTKTFVQHWFGWALWYFSSPWLHSRTLPTFYTFAGKPNPAYKPFHYTVRTGSSCAL